MVFGSDDLSASDSEKVPSIEVFKQLLPDGVRIVGDKLTSSNRFGDYATIQDGLLAWLGDIEDIPDYLPIGQIVAVNMSKDFVLNITYNDLDDIDDKPSIGKVWPENWQPLDNPFNGVDISEDLSATNLKNVIRLLCPGWPQAFYTDEFGQHWLDYSKLHAEPPSNGEKPLEIPVNPLVCVDNDLNTKELREWLENTLLKTKHHRDGTPFNVRPSINRKTVCEIATEVCEYYYKDTFLEKIRAVQWDGVERYASLLRDVGCRPMGDPDIAEDSPGWAYVEAVSRAIFLCPLELAKGTDNPVKFVPILYGAQNSRKSSLLTRIGLGTTINGGHKKDLSDRLDWLKGADLSAIMRNVIICELPEATALQGMTEDAKKSTLEVTQYDYRVLYTHANSSVRRRCLYAITTNDSGILSDVTGNSRYYPVQMAVNWAVLGPNDDLDNNYILQCWAEAYKDFEDGVRYSDVLEDVTEQAEESRNAINRVQNDAQWEDLLTHINDMISIEGFIFCTEVSHWIEGNYYGKDKQRIKAQWSKYWATKYNKRSKRDEYGNVKDAFYPKLDVA